MGRKPWSTRLCVEDCPTLSIRVAKAAGLLDALPGTRFPAMANDIAMSLQIEHHLWPRLHLWLRLYVEFNATLHPLPPQRIDLSVTQCHFGGCRDWFCCPMPGCNVRVAMLYMLPGGSHFACRACLNLTYRSVKNHDKRVDALVRGSMHELRVHLNAGDGRARIALTAINRIRARTQQRIRHGSAALSPESQ
jgi:hypothetical protein